MPGGNQVASETLPPMIAGKYRPLRTLGSGGMGTVYEVENVNTGDHWALKVLLEHVVFDPATVERFRREARVSALIKTDHIVRVIDVDFAPELKGSPYIVMELLEGKTLGDVGGETPQRPEQVVEWMRQVARALDKAHAKGIIHRDLKPGNLFLTQREDGSPVVKILDFGIAKIRMGEDAKHTTVGSVMGTPLFMSPEQAKGESDAIGPWTDVWALGMTAYRLLTGKDYWSGAAASAVMAKIIYEAVVPPSARGCTLGESFDAWFLRSCARDHVARFQSVREQVASLADALGCKLDSWAVGASGSPASTGDTLRTPSLPSAAASSNAESIGGAYADTAIAPQKSRGSRTLLLAAAAAVAGTGIWFAASRTHRAGEPAAGQQDGAVSAVIERPSATPLDNAVASASAAPVVSVSASGSAPSVPPSVPPVRLTPGSPGTRATTSAIAPAPAPKPTTRIDPLADPH